MLSRRSCSLCNPIPQKPPSEVEGGSVATGDGRGDDRSRRSKVVRLGEAGLELVPAFDFAFSDPFRKGISKASIDL